MGEGTRMLVTVPEDAHKKLKQMRKETSMPMSQCINMLVSQWVKDNIKDEKASSEKNS